MKPKTYQILQNAIEAGISYSIRRAHKHTDHPSEDHLEVELDLAIWNEIHEVFEFENDFDD